jgi:predicted nucleic acid-binding protein
MIQRFLVDTDILVDFLRGNREAINFVKIYAKNIVLSAISVAEVYAGIRDNKERKELDDFIGLFPIISVSFEIAQMGGLYKRDFFKSHNIGIADAIIAATSKTSKLDLKILNIKHFPMFDDLKPPYKKNKGAGDGA